MKLLRTYLKLIMIRYRMNYLSIVLSLTATYITIAVITVYIDNLFILSTNLLFPDMRNIYVGIRTIFFIGGFANIVNQYFNIMKSSMRNYCILKALGATKDNIRILILLQAFSLMLITVPIGLFAGYLITGSILNFLVDFTMNNHLLKTIDSTNTLLIASIVICCFILSIGVYLERVVRKMSLSNILSDNPILGKEVSIWYY